MGRRKIFLFLGFAFFLIFVFFLGRTTAPKKEGQPPEPTPSPKTEIKPASTKEELLTRLEEIFADSPDIDLAVSILDLKTAEDFGLNAEETQHAASIPKVLTAAYLLKKVQDKELKLTDKLGTYNLEFNLKQMVNQSNTVAWEMIDDFLGIEPQEDFARSLGLTSFKMRENEISPRDAVLLFQKLYQGKILNERLTKKLLGYMQNTETENLITPKIPKEIPLYHKSGLFEGQVHDVGIVVHPKRPFIFAIFTVNKIRPDYEGRAKLIQKAAQEVYAYFNRLP